MNDRYPHACPLCASPAYVGVHKIECSGATCKHRLPRPVDISVGHEDSFRHADGGIIAGPMNIEDRKAGPTITFGTPPSDDAAVPVDPLDVLLYIHNSDGTIVEARSMKPEDFKPPLPAGSTAVMFSDGQISVTEPAATSDPLVAKTAELVRSGGPDSPDSCAIIFNGGEAAHHPNTTALQRAAFPLSDKPGPCECVTCRAERDDGVFNGATAEDVRKACDENRALWQTPMDILRDTGRKVGKLMRKTLDEARLIRSTIWCGDEYLGCFLVPIGRNPCRMYVDWLGETRGTVDELIVFTDWLCDRGCDRVTMLEARAKELGSEEETWVGKEPTHAAYRRKILEANYMFTADRIEEIERVLMTERFGRGLTIPLETLLRALEDRGGQLLTLTETEKVVRAIEQETP